VGGGSGPGVAGWVAWTWGGVGPCYAPRSYVEGEGRRWATAAHEYCAPGRGAPAGGGQCGMRGRHGRPAGAVPAGPPSASATTRSGDTASAAAPREMAAWHCPQRPPPQRNGYLA